MTMSLTGPRTVKLSDIKITAYVRQTLDDDHVLYLADLYEHGVPVEPIVVTDRLELVKGRHRLEAMLLAGLKETKALFTKPLPPSELLITALADDLKGSLPPSANDIQFVIQQLLELGIATNDISDRLKRVLPVSLSRKYIDVVKKRIERKKLATIITEVFEGALSISAAAKKYSVTEAAIREAMGIRQKKAKANMATTFSAIETRVRGLGQQMTASAKALVSAFHDGEIGEKELNEYVDRIKQSTSRLKRNATNIEERIEAAKSNGHVGGDD